MLLGSCPGDKKPGDKKPGDKELGEEKPGNVGTKSMGTRSLGTNEEPGDKGTLYTYHTQLQPHTFSIPDDIILVTPPPAQPAGGLQCTTHSHNRTHIWYLHYS